MEKRTVISSLILVVVICALLGISIVSPHLWVNHVTHWIVPPAIAVFMTLLVGLVLMDKIFELDADLIIPLKKFGLKIEIKKYLVWAFVLICAVAVVLEVVQFFLFRDTVNWTDPLGVLAGSVFGIFLHIVGSKTLMKRVEFELERWEDNVL